MSEIRIDDTVDYELIYNQIKNLVETKRYSLIEKNKRILTWINLHFWCLYHFNILKAPLFC